MKNVDILINDKSYPPSLKEIHFPPKILHMSGSMLDCDRFAVAMVGSRNATLYGLTVAEKLAYDLAECGITIVSGLARGIDAASHRGALKAGGRTIAVLGSGLDKIYPKEHSDLAAAISKQGCVLSEFPNNMEAFPSNFPLRNRIISSLSLGVIVVEASRRSGSLITATHAIEQGKQIFAVPGHIDSLLSEGAHSLIKEGAKLIECAEDVLEELQPVLKDMLPKAPSKQNEDIEKTQTSISPLETEIIELLHEGPLPLEEIVDILGSAPADIQKTLVQLEVGGKIKRSFGATYEVP